MIGGEDIFLNSLINYQADSCLKMDLELSWVHRPCCVYIPKEIFGVAAKDIIACSVESMAESLDKTWVIASPQDSRTSQGVYHSTCIYVIVQA